MNSFLWVSCTDPVSMIEYVCRMGSLEAIKTSEGDYGRDTRKLELTMCAFGRVIWTRLPEEGKTLVKRLEKFAENPSQNSFEPIRDCWKAHFASALGIPHSSGKYVQTFLYELGYPSMSVAHYEKVTAKFSSLWAGYPTYAVNIIRSIFGNPSARSAYPCPESKWLRDSTVQSIAKDIYEDMTFDMMPILADALEDAGCEHALTLSSLRDSGPRFRGHWALDLILGK